MGKNNPYFWNLAKYSMRDRYTTPSVLGRGRRLCLAANTGVNPRVSKVLCNVAFLSSLISIDRSKTELENDILTSGYWLLIFIQLQRLQFNMMVHNSHRCCFFCFPNGLRDCLDCVGVGVSVALHVYTLTYTQSYPSGGLSDILVLWHSLFLSIPPTTFHNSPPFKHIPMDGSPCLEG